ncbi:MAG: pyruvate kinase [Gammaproteobacteria bacterium]
MHNPDINPIARRTKIVATLGPATDRGDELARMVAAGVDVVRLNFSHGEHAEQRRRVAAVRAVAKEQGRDVGVLMDLQGPKIRIQRFRNEEIELAEGDVFTLDTSLAPDAGDALQVGVSYKNLPHDVSDGDVLVLGDGEIALEIQTIEGPRVHCKVLAGGSLSDHKGLNRRGGGLSAEALTEKDREDIKVAAELECDYLAVSFPRNASDIERARRLLREAGGEGAIVAKIERSEAVENLDAIILASDAVMIARGDLAVEIGDALLPGVQKRVVRRARDHNTAVIVATQMMESMVTSPVPTRAEILDVANAVLDGTDAVMLSEETAVGRHPAKVVQAMARVCLGAEEEPSAEGNRRSKDEHFMRVDKTIANAAMFIARHLDLRALVALTVSGTTALYMSRLRSGIPIYALTPHQATRRRMTLYRGVYPVPFDEQDGSGGDELHEAVATLAKLEVVAEDDLILITHGEFRGVTGGTNSLHLLRVGDILNSR